MTFAFNRDYRDAEQVRAFFPAYLAARAGLIRARGGDPDNPGEWVYNEDLRGTIPGIEGPDEDTAIYLLQGLYRSDVDAVRLDAARARGGVPLDDLDPARMHGGTLVCHGWYVGGTGYAEHRNVRLGHASRGWVFFPPRAKIARSLPPGAKLFIPKEGA